MSLLPFCRVQSKLANGHPPDLGFAKVSLDGFARTCPDAGCEFHAHALLVVIGTCPRATIRDCSETASAITECDWALIRGRSCPWLISHPSSRAVTGSLNRTRILHL